MSMLRACGRPVQTEMMRCRVLPVSAFEGERAEALKTTDAPTVNEAVAQAGIGLLP